MRNVFVAGPVSWNQLVYLDRLPEPRPRTIFARRQVQAIGGTSAGKSLNLAALGAEVTLNTVVGDDALRAGHAQAARCLASPDLAPTASAEDRP